MLSLGVTSPFLHIGLAHNYATVGDVVPVLHKIGDSLNRYKLPKVVAPLTFAFTGSGNVSQVGVILFIRFLFVLVLVSRSISDPCGVEFFTEKLGLYMF